MKLEDMPQELIDNRPRKPLPIVGWDGNKVTMEKELFCQKINERLKTKQKDKI